MKKTMYIISAGSTALCVACAVAYAAYKVSIFYSLAITFGTIAYHFLMRLAVGFIFNVTMNNRADCTKGWFRQRKWEKKLYKRLKVKRWKKHLPTFDPDVFNLSLHSREEIAQAMCQAELVHEVIVILSFVPLVFSIWFGAFWVFAVTSVLSAALDLMFVIMQRSNRPRVIRLINREKVKNNEA